MFSGVWGVTVGVLGVSRRIGKLYGREFDTRKYDSREYFRTQRNSNTNLQALLNSLSIENLNIYIINRQKIIEILQPDAQILP